jgi:integrase
VPIGPVPFGTIIAAWGRSEAKPAKPTIRAHTSKANRLIQHLGFDDMAKVTEEQMIGYKDHLLSTDLDHATIGNHLSALHTLFRYAKRNRKITIDPMAELVFKAKSDGRAKRMPFSRTDRALVLEHARQCTNPTIKWSNLLSGFSGMRLAEIVEAHNRDVEIIDGMPVFHVRLDNRPPEMSIKNAVSLRTLPIHSTVLAEGFLDYVKSVGDGPLFPGVSIDHDGRRATNASRVISEWLREVVGITDPRLVFHSHRHSVKSILRNHESRPRDDIVNKILGHIGGKDDSGRDQGAATAADGYGIFQLRAMQRIIELIREHREKEVAIAA